MFSYLIVAIILSLTIISQSIDPDIELCDELTIDSAFVADDGQAYVFKGEHYWKLNLRDGLSEDAAEPISSRWPDLPSHIEAAFSIDEQTHRRSTVFLKERQWYLYKGREQISVGTTEEWPEYPYDPIDTAFTYVNKSVVPRDYPVFLIFDTHYLKYTFNNINSPNIHVSSTSYTAGNFLLFVSDQIQTTDTTIQDVIQARAAVCDETYLIVFGIENYCKTNASSFAPLCRVESPANYFKCPRDARPSTTTTTTTTTTTEITTFASDSSPTLEANNNDIENETENVNNSKVVTDRDSTTKIGNNSNGSTKDESDIKSDNSEPKSNKLVIILVVIFLVLVFIGAIAGVVAYVWFRRHKKKKSLKTKEKTKSDKTKSNESIKSNNDTSDNNDNKTVKKSVSDEELSYGNFSESFHPSTEAFRRDAGTPRSPSQESLITSLKKTRSKLAGSDEKIQVSKQSKQKSKKNGGVGEADEILENMSIKSKEYH